MIKRPGFTPIPDKFFDVWMSMLSLSELRVCLYILRRTKGFNRECDCISLSQFQYGIETRQGEQLDKGTGLSESGVKKGIASLLKKNLIFRESSNDGKTPARYSWIVWPEGVTPVPPSNRDGVTDVTMRGSQAWPQKPPKGVTPVTPQDTEEQKTAQQTVCLAETARPDRQTDPSSSISVDGDPIKWIQSKLRSEVIGIHGGAKFNKKQEVDIRDWEQEVSKRQGDAGVREVRSVVAIIFQDQADPNVRAKRIYGLYNVARTGAKVHGDWKSDKQQRQQGPRRITSEERSKAIAEFLKGGDK